MLGQRHEHQLRIQSICVQRASQNHTVAGGLRVFGDEVGSQRTEVKEGHCTPKVGYNTLSGGRVYENNPMLRVVLITPLQSTGPLWHILGCDTLRV